MLKTQCKNCRMPL